MAKQIIVLAFIIFFAAVGMASAQENNHDVPAAAANLAPAAAAAGLNIANASQLIGALQGAGGPIPEGVFKNLAPGSNQPEAKSGAAAFEATAAAGTIAAAGVVGSFFFF